MNILMVSALDVKDKGAQSLKKTIEGYLRKNHKVFFISYKKGSQEPDYFYEDNSPLIRENFFYHSIRLPFSFLDNNFYTRKIRLSVIFPFLSYIKVRKILAREKIDLLYGYEIHGVLAVKLIKHLFNRILVVSRFQGTILYPLVKDSKFLFKYRDHVSALSYPVDLVIMTDDGTRGDLVLKKFGVAKSKVRFWRNGVANDLFDPKYSNWIRSNYSIDDGTKVLLTISRLVHWKRVDRAISALKFISDQVKSVLLIIGDGPEKSDLESLARSLGISEKIIFVGSVKNEEVYKFLNSCDIFLSLYDLSNLGNPVMEAMSCGRTVLAIDHGEMDEIIEDVKTGFLVKSDGEIGEKLLGILQNDKLRIEVGNNAHEISKKKFWTWEERMEAEIREVENLV